MESRERTKLYIVIGLLPIFFAVGYFRFIHGKITFFSRPERSVAPAASEVPVIDLKSVRPTGQPQKMSSEGPRTELRDIFAPVKAQASMIPSATDAAIPATPLPNLQLMGTIIGGKRPMAVINGQFLRKGEMIAGFEVVSIARDRVALSGGGRKVLLKILTGAEERPP